jgi:hypothetical protein
LYPEFRTAFAVEPPGAAPATGSSEHGILPNLEEHSAAHLLLVSALDTSRPLVAFDILERIDPPKKEGKHPKPYAYKRARDGDWQLLKAIHSSLSAAFYWRQQDYTYGDPFVVLNVPVCLLSGSFWDVCIDEAKVGEPAIRNRGYQSNSYPDRPNPTQAMVLVWTKDELPTLVGALDDLFVWFRAELRKPEYLAHWPNSAV